MKSSHLRRLKAAVARGPATDPDADPDGVFTYFGANPAWTPDREGQAPAQPPPVGQHSRHDWDTCPTCGKAVGTDYLTDDRLTCAGCLRSSAKMEKHLLAKYQRDEAKEEAQRKAREEAAQPKPFAERKHGAKAGL